VHLLHRSRLLPAALLVAFLPTKPSQLVWIYGGSVGGCGTLCRL
jgi:hypothetical protein